MITGSISLAGDKELMEFLKELPTKLQKRHLDFALTQAAVPMKNRAQAYAPVRTGLLKSSLTVKPLKKKRKGINGVRVSTESGDYRGDTFYAAFQEYGWMKQPVIRIANGQIRSVKRGRMKSKRKKIPGKRFMKRAFDATRHVSQEIFTKALRTSINAEVQTMADKAAKAVASQTARESRALARLAKRANS